MAIDPLKSHHLGLQDAARAAQSAQASSSDAVPATDAEDAAARRDSVELSSELRSLGDAAPVAGSAGTLPADRLKQITARIESGFYDDATVRNEVASRLASDSGAS